MKQEDLRQEDFYIDENGRICFTEEYHLKRGYCCGSGCRHCPYRQEKKLPTHRQSAIVVPLTEPR